MATKKVSATNSASILGAPALAAQASSLVQGVFVGLDSSGNAKLADFRLSQGPVVARGALREDIQLKDPRGNVIETHARASFVTEGRISNITAVGSLTLTPGSTYFLSSGGGIQKESPATGGTDGLDQKVGWAISSTDLIIEIGTALKSGNAY